MSDNEGIHRDPIETNNTAAIYLVILRNYRWEHRTTGFELDEPGQLGGHFRWFPEARQMQNLKFGLNRLRSQIQNDFPSNVGRIIDRIRQKMVHSTNRNPSFFIRWVITYLEIYPILKFLKSCWICRIWWVFKKQFSEIIFNRWSKNWLLGNEPIKQTFNLFP